jgi:hypothetical protein
MSIKSARVCYPNRDHFMMIRRSARDKREITMQGVNIEIKIYPFAGGTFPKQACRTGTENKQ